LVGSIIYVMLGGICGAAGVALMLKLSRHAGNAASTWFAAFWSISNLPWVYMQWIDGRGYKLFGPRGMFALDALGNSLPAIAFLIFLRRSSAAACGLPPQAAQSDTYPQVM
jgi:hypothetical protein